MGRAAVECFAREGAHAVVADIDEELSHKVVADVVSSGGSASAIPLDVTNRDAVFAAVDSVARERGSVDVMVNNAGIVTLCSIEDMTDAEWDKVQEVNVKGVLYCCQAAMKWMKKKGSGRIINISSVSIKTGGVLPYAHYVASKAAVWALTKSLARELAPYSITVNGVAPGSIGNTEFSKDFPPHVKTPTDPMIPLSRRGRPEDVAPAVVFLASEQAGYITGELLDVNGGIIMD